MEPTGDVNATARATVSVVIPSFAEQPLLRRLAADASMGVSVIEVIVSHSGTPKPELGPEITVIHNDEPLPVSIARNRGAALARGDLILFIDDDNVVGPGCVDNLCHWMTLHPDVVVAGPAMYYAEDCARPYCFGTLHRGILNRTRFLVSGPETNDVVVESDSLPNAFMVRRAQFQSIGGFDEVCFPFHYEESDLAYRLRKRFKGRVTCLTTASVFHAAPLPTTRRLQPKQPFRSYMMARNRPLFIVRHLGIPTYLVYMCMGQFLYGLAYIGAMMRLPRKRRGANVSAYLRGMLDGARISLRLLLAGHAHG